MKRKFREKLIPGEALAIRRDADVIDLYVQDPITPNEYPIDGVAVVHIRGPLEHHLGPCENYESIALRFEEAADCMQGGVVVIRMDSPGGVVSGLNETVYKLRSLKKKHGVRVIAYVDEMACSAAYALSTAADEIVGPESAVAGSIGVISQMYDQVGMDERAGLRFAIVTSGDRKADGHPHMPLTEDAIDVERTRVNQLATAFFRMVEEARPISAATAESYQAGIYLAPEAVEKGLMDDVMTWDELISTISLASGGSAVTPLGGSDLTPGVSMLKLHAAIKVAKQRLAKMKSKDARIRLRAAIAKHEALLSLNLPTSAIQASWNAMKKTKYTLEEEETVEDDSEEEEEEGGNQTDRTEGDDDTTDDSDDGDKAESEEEEEEASARSKADADDPPGPKGKKAKARRAESEEEEEEAAADDSDEEAAAPGQEDDDAKAESEEEEEEARSRGKRAARKAAANMTARERKLLAELQREKNDRTRADLIATALKAKRITPAMSRDLKTKPLAEVRGFLDLMKRPIIAGVEEADEQPTTATPKHSRSIIEDAAMALGKTPDEVQRLSAEAPRFSEKALAGPGAESRALDTMPRVTNGVGGNFAYIKSPFNGGHN